MRWPAGAAAAAALVLVVAGCGGSSSTSQSTTSATQTWANGVCDAFATWKTKVTNAKASVADRSAVSKNTLQAAIDNVRAANQELASSLDQLEKPRTESAGQATHVVDTLRGQLQSGFSSIQSALTSTSQPLAVVSTVTGELSQMRTQVQSAVDSIQKLDVKGELSAAFQQAPACEPFLGR